MMPFIASMIILAFTSKNSQHLRQKVFHTIRALDKMQLNHSLEVYRVFYTVAKCRSITFAANETGNFPASSQSVREAIGRIPGNEAVYQDFQGRTPDRGGRASLFLCFQRAMNR